MKAENCQAIVDEHIKKYGSLDVLVNNASKQIMSKSLEEIDVRLFPRIDESGYDADLGRQNQVGQC